MMAKTRLKVRLLGLLSLTFLIIAPIVFAEEAMVVLRSTVTGNQEQPKVLYLVPWQQAEGPESLYRPLKSLVSEVFEPIERREFIREMAYRQNLSDDRAAIQDTQHQ